MPKDYTLPVSVKCVVFEDDKVWLRKNERGEWELPGGKMDPGEQPEQTAKREAREELGLDVVVSDIVGATLYKIPLSPSENRGVLVLAYICDILERVGDVEHVGEAGESEFKTFTPAETADLNMPEFYKQWITYALE